MPTLDPMATIEDVIRLSIGNATGAEAQLKQYLDVLKPDIELALSTGDLMSLGYLRDRAVMSAGRVSLGLIYQQKAIVATAVTTAVQVLIKVGIAAVVV